MKVTHVTALVALSLLAMSNSCKKEDPAPCPSVRLIETAQVTNLRAAIAEPIPTTGQSHQYVVNSLAEYQALFTTKALPPVDFSAYTLLAGKTRLPGTGRVVAQQVTQSCTGYTYTVKLAAPQDSAAANLSYYVLVPKLPAGAKVEFDVQLPQTLQAQR